MKYVYMILETLIGGLFVASAFLTVNFSTLVICVGGAILAFITSYTTYTTTHRELQLNMYIPMATDYRDGSKTIIMGLIMASLIVFLPIGLSGYTLFAISAIIIIHGVLEIIENYLTRAERLG